MKIKIILISFVLSLCLGCKREEKKEFTFDYFVLSYSGLRHANSIKITNSDTIFMQKIFPQPTKNFYAIIPANKKIRLIKNLQSLNFKKFESEYAQEHLCDGGNYLISLYSNGKNRSISIYGNTAPKELYNFIDSLYMFKDDLKFIATKQIIDCGDLSSITPPQLPPLPPLLKTK